MTNDEIRMTNETRNQKPETETRGNAAHSSFVLRHSGLFLLPCCLAALLPWLTSCSLLQQNDTPSKVARSRRATTTAPVTTPADLNLDGFVDGSDYTIFMACFNGANAPKSKHCPDFVALADKFSQLDPKIIEAARKLVMETTFTVDLKSFCEVAPPRAMAMDVKLIGIGTVRFFGIEDASGKVVMRGEP